MHLDDERIQRLIHGELPDHSAADHVAECSVCQTRVAEARAEDQEINALLHSLDHRPPNFSAEMLVQRARVRNPGVGRWAAGILLAAAVAGAAYAVERIIESERRSPVISDSTFRPLPTPAPPRQGIGITPGNSLMIMFATNQTEGRVTVVLHDSAQVWVESVGGNAPFVSDVDRVLIDNAGSSADYEIGVPRTAAHVEIHVNNRRIFLKQGSSIMADVQPDARGAYVLGLSARRN